MDGDTHLSLKLVPCTKCLVDLNSHSFMSGGGQPLPLSGVERPANLSVGHRPAGGMGPGWRLGAGSAAARGAGGGGYRWLAAARPRGRARRPAARCQQPAAREIGRGARLAARPAPRRPGSGGPRRGSGIATRPRIHRAAAAGRGGPPTGAIRQAGHALAQLAGVVAHVAHGSGVIDCGVGVGRALQPSPLRHPTLAAASRHATPAGGRGRGHSLEDIVA
jgi:hypothetical protein